MRDEPGRTVTEGWSPPEPATFPETPSRPSAGLRGGPPRHVDDLVVAVLVAVGAEGEAGPLLALADRGERLEAGGGERGADDVDRPVALAVDAGLDSLARDLGP